MFEYARNITKIAREFEDTRTKSNNDNSKNLWTSAEIREYGEGGKNILFSYYSKTKFKFLKPKFLLFDIIFVNSSQQ